MPDDLGPRFRLILFGKSGHRGVSVFQILYPAMFAFGVGIPPYIFCTCASSRISWTVSSLMILPVRLWNAAHSCSASLL